MDKPVLIEGGQFSDERGSLRFVNSFDFKDLKRFYIIEQPKNFVRAWQGHKIENKYFYVISGSFLICGVKIDDWENPSSDLKVHEYHLSEKESQIFMIPGGYANGFKALEDNSNLLVFSNLSLEESKQDDYRFDKSMWKNWDK
jgi:dTDP-4-dehydrorhamnose 3,5-epimerase